MFLFKDPATTEIYTLSIHDALPMLDSLTGDPQITLSAATVATGIIDDNDSATVSISDTPTVTEGSEQHITDPLSPPRSTYPTIRYSFGGTADGATDYTHTMTTMTIA